MAHKYNWSKEKYIDALLGNAERGLLYGLRDIAYGFERKNGFDPRSFERWTPAMRRRIRDYARRVEILSAQPKTAIRVSDAKKRKVMQSAFHGAVPSGRFKVVFHPSFQPQPGVISERAARTKFRFFKDGVSEVLPGDFERVFIPFNQKRLATNTVKEIERAAKLVPGARMYFISTGENATLKHGMSLSIVIGTILKWMEMYDGKKELPRTSGNRGDNPKYHHWRLWLNGLIGFKFPHNVDIRSAKRKINEGLKAVKEVKRQRYNYMRRQTPIKRKGKK